MDKQRVVSLLHQAADNPAVHSIAEQALGRYIRHIAQAEAKLCSLSKDDADEAAHRALTRVLKYVMAKSITDPAHIVNLAVYCLRGGPQRDENNTVISQPNGKFP